MNLADRMAEREANAATYKVKNVVATIALDLEPSSFEDIVWPEGPSEKAILVGCVVEHVVMLYVFNKTNTNR